MCSYNGFKERKPMMTNEQLKEIKETFVKLEGVLAKVNSVESLFKDDIGFKDVFTKAHRCLGILENEWALKIPGAFDSREAIDNVLERIEIIRHYMTQGIELPQGVSLPDKLKDVKEILADVNRHLNGK